ncbi:hypothetical protein FHT40_000035 [Mycolicibacterium sp. BK556]|uniref:hypothetical protein n=1 Tax=Mycobacteriaceae TaxID=1762 RepID=UPI001062301B|nr:MULTISPECIES: hypothetical protein [Mycobacteriaceae]MBB3600402.1 hypothetical protein [Mycolicibacterium sp. BK556]MBB3630154.1 hypothetical protein [Mycolicibacterium sp. BK607]MBB3748152.1 hypothetical protein [Mycolicibacterium sp. BK634]TDO09968.1 hypothetical protein EV580_4253 [Mycobacterium sp. BK086]
MTEIACSDCENVVLVERYTDNQMCVQWQGDAEAICIEFARRAAKGERSMVIPSCRTLRTSIELNIANLVIRVAPHRGSESELFGDEAT